jgi:hypothetical protein
MAGQMGSVDASRFDRERFFKSDSVANILEELERIRNTRKGEAVNLFIRGPHR